MSAALRLYEQLTEATDDKTRACFIAEAFDALKTRYPQIAELATQGHVRKSEPRLKKEIKEVEGGRQKELKEVGARLQTEIKEVEARLQQEIKQLELKISEVGGRLRTDIAHIKTGLLKWLLPTMLAQVAAIAALFKLL